jgi:predicted transcriptional regulator
VALTTAEDMLRDLATAYGQLARGLEQSSSRMAERTLDELGALEGAGTDLDTAVEATRERINLGASRTRLTQSRRLRAVEQLAARAGLMVTSARSCARGVATLARYGRRADPGLVTALEELAQALRDLSAWVRGQARRDAVVQSALRAAVSASATLRRPRASPASLALAWQIRAATVDVLRVLGLSHDSAVAALEDAAGRADRGHEGDGGD